MRPDDLAAIERVVDLHLPDRLSASALRTTTLLHPQRERPLRSVKILRLHGAKPTHHLNGRLKLRSGEFVIAKAFLHELSSVHVVQVGHKSSVVSKSTALT